MPAAALRLVRVLSLPSLDASRKKKLGNAVGLVVGAVFLVLAVRVMRSELNPAVWRQVPAALANLADWRVALAVVVALASYCWLGCFDWLSARMVNAEAVKPGHAVRTGFIGYALTHNLGLSAFTGTALRLHRYRRRGVSGGDVVRLYLTNVVTMWLGFACTLGVVVALAPSGLWHMDTAWERTIGVVLVAAVAGFIVACNAGLPALTVRGHRFALPGGRHAAVQLVVGVTHWVVSAVVLWLLLPAGPTLAAVIGALCLGQIVVVITHVPGGVGVLEGTLLLMLRGKIDPAALAAGVVLYRAVYYLLPLGVSALIVLVEKLWRAPLAEPAVAPVVAR